MNRSESKYYNTACLMDEAFLLILEKKEYEYITVGEVCAKAGVNRSTFYLHYESMVDLLEESMELVNKRFWACFKPDDASVIERLSDCPLEELDFTAPKYLLPYLEFIKEHKKMFITIVKNRGIFQLENTYEKMFQNVFSPVLDRFNYPDEQKRFVIGYYVGGIMSIVGEWLKTDCKIDTQEIIEIIQKCINRK